MKNGDLKDVRAGELAEKSELVAGEQADLSTVYFYRNPATNKFEISESPKTYVPVKKGDENHPEIENQDFSSDKIYLNYYDVSEFKNKIPGAPVKIEGCYEKEKISTYLKARHHRKKVEYLLFNSKDSNDTSRNIYGAILVCDKKNLKLTMKLESFFPQDEKELIFDMRNGIIEGLDDMESENEFWECERHIDFPPDLVKKAYEKLVELGQLYTGIQIKGKDIKDLELFEILHEMNIFLNLPFEPNLYQIIYKYNISSEKKFTYDRQDSLVYNKFCAFAEIRNYRLLRKCYNKKPLSLLIYLILKDCGFTDINLYNRVLTDDKNFSEIKDMSAEALIFFCKYSIERRGELCTMNTILRNISDVDSYTKRDIINMFKEYFSLIPDTLKEDILMNGFTNFNHDALTNISYRSRYENRPIEYTAQEKRLECDIEGYQFRLPENTWKLCEIGTVMHNCVASYSEAACEKKCTIVYALKDEECTLCIELRGNFIYQERTDHNGRPGKKAREVLEKWHIKNGLKFKE